MNQWSLLFFIDDGTVYQRFRLLSSVSADNSGKHIAFFTFSHMKSNTVSTLSIQAVSQATGEGKNALYFATCLFVAFSLFASPANSQNLFGNPSCTNWKTTSGIEKSTWLNAFLAPLNLTHISRKKTAEDKFNKLASLDPAVHYVDKFCELNENEFASVGAIQFLDKLTSGNLP